MAGTLVYIFAMWNSGIIQGLMWRTYNENNVLAYSFIESMVAMHPYYVARAFGGFLFFAGGVVGLYNVVKTIQQAPRAQAEQASDRPVGALARSGAVQPGE